MKSMVYELGAYGAASAAALALDMGLLTWLVNAGWHYIPAAVVSFVAGGVLMYVLCTRFVFRFRRIRNPAVELPYFIALGVVGLLITNLVMFVAVEAAHLHYLAAKSAAAVCTFTTNFLLRRKVLFSSPARPSAPSTQPE